MVQNPVSKMLLHSKHFYPDLYIYYSHFNKTHWYFKIGWTTCRFQKIPLHQWYESV